MDVDQDRSTRQLYDLWAPSYPPVPHNPLMRAEQSLMLEEWPEVSGQITLDLGCGTGRYAKLLASSGAAQVVAVDLSTAMLGRVQVGWQVCASMTRLPFACGVFDIVISGLAVGHVADLAEWMAEVARVLAPGGMLLYSDFHPAAASAGMTRSFKDLSGRAHTLPHYRHEIAAHRAAAKGAHLVIERVGEARVGYEVSEPFSGTEAVYRRWDGLPLVLVVSARKGAS
jgi:malonyl-CoA O-methyltransferase